MGWQHIRRKQKPVIQYLLAQVCKLQKQVSKIFTNFRKTLQNLFQFFMLIEKDAP